MGVIYATLAIFGWGLGDFLIQRSARKLGDWEALFFVVLFATLALLPFTYTRLSLLTQSDTLVLLLTSVVILVASLLDFDALRVGKMAIVEPIYAMEVPITIALSTLLVGEFLSGQQFIFIGGILVGVYLVSNKKLSILRLRSLERGVLTAVFATIGMGAANFLYGFGSREIDPLMINWFTSAFMTVATLAYLVYTKQTHLLLSNLRKNTKLLFAVGASDAVAWVGFSASTLYLPIGIATGLTESYIALAAILGLTFNRERLVAHQKLGLAIAVLAAVALAFTVS